MSVCHSAARGEGRPTSLPSVRGFSFMSVALCAIPAPAVAATPLSYLDSYGPRADPVRTLTWALLILSIVVVLVVTGLVVWATFRGGPAQESGITREGNGLRFIAAGLAVTVVALLASVVWTMVVLARVGAPPAEPRLTLDISGRQWWWQVRYQGERPVETFVTANEMHIPVGEPVRVNLSSADVIHSFWVPALSGKTDAVPGQTNTAWIEADTPGVYLGQCTEFCGTQHAHMGLTVVAEPRPAFEAWLKGQLAPAPQPQEAVAAAGQETFARRCAVCHAVRGTAAGGIFGPDLSHLATRRTLAAATIPNTPGYLSAWIADPQHLKPGTRMPNVALAGSELEQVRAYLSTLR